MADNSSSNTASVAIVILVIVALAFAYFVFIRTADNDLNIDVDIKKDGGVGALSPGTEAPPLVAWRLADLSTPSPAALA